MRLTLFNITKPTEVDMHGVALRKWKKLQWYRKATFSIKRYIGVRGGTIAKFDKLTKDKSLPIIQLLP